MTEQEAHDRMHEKADAVSERLESVFTQSALEGFDCEDVLRAGAEWFGKDDPDVVALKKAIKEHDKFFPLANPTGEPKVVINIGMLQDAIKDMDRNGTIELSISDPPFDSNYKIDGFNNIDGKLVVSVSDHGEETLNVRYRCPNCGHKWEEDYTAACDSECGECGTENITALMHKRPEDDWTDAEKAEWDKAD